MAWFRFYVDYFSNTEHTSSLIRRQSFNNFFLNFEKTEIQKTSFGLDYILVPRSESIFFGFGIVQMDAIVKHDTNIIAIGGGSSGIPRTEFSKEVKASGTLPFLRIGYIWKHIEVSYAIAFGKLSKSSSHIRSLSPSNFSIDGAYEFSSITSFSLGLKHNFLKLT